MINTAVNNSSNSSASEAISAELQAVRIAHATVYRRRREREITMAAALERARKLLSGSGIPAERAPKNDAS